MQFGINRHNISNVKKTSRSLTSMHCSSEICTRLLAIWETNDTIGFLKWMQMMTFVTMKSQRLCWQLVYPRQWSAIMGVHRYLRGVQRIHNGNQPIVSERPWSLQFWSVNFYHSTKSSGQIQMIDLSGPKFTTKTCTATTQNVSTVL